MTTALIILASFAVGVVCGWLWSHRIPRSLQRTIDNLEDQGGAGA